MDSPDQSFVKAFGPIHVPHKYEAGASLQDNIVYALAQLEHATAPEVANKMAEFEPATDLAIHKKNAQEILSELFEKGRIKGDDNAENRAFNLSKILTQNSGKADELF
ncbi:hypothetical protein A0256_21345 [Mucilaginibacter sp. PAMC 26640]|nr:hypothetical protein A0256_21345 [Mucilaginibacter sp. PAMC 26640]